MKPQLIFAVLISGMISTAAEQTHWAMISQNPFSDMIKLPVENRFDGNYGYDDALNYRIAFQPSIGGNFSKDWNLVNRLDIAFHYQPGRTPGESDSFGLGDTTYESFLGPSDANTFFWGIGPVVQIPTATDNQLGSRKWSAGPAGAFAVVGGPFVLGARANHLWSFAGKDNREDVNRTTFEYFLYANFGDGWWIGTAPENIANWDLASDEIWTVPVGGGIGKMVGQRHPVNLSLEVYGYAEAPTDYADWSVMLSIELLVPESSLFKRTKP